jgi:two-component system chemotaxis response regulator CheY
LAGERVLLIDDDESIRQIVTLLLSDEGYIVREASNGQIGLNALDDYRPHVILLDLRMPVMDGWEFARRYRKLPGPHAPIVAFVAALSVDQAQLGIEAARVLAKPFDLDELLSALSKVLAPLAPDAATITRS